MTMTIGYVALVGIGKDLTYGDNMRNSRVQRNMIFRQKWHAYRAHVLDFVGREYRIDDIVDADIDLDNLKAIIRTHKNTKHDTNDEFLNVIFEVESHESMSEWTHLFMACKDDVDYIEKSVQTIHVSNSIHNSGFTIIICTESGEDVLTNYLMYTHAFVDNDLSILHAVLHSVFFILKDILGNSAPEKVRDLSKSKDFNLQHIIETNNQILRCSIPSNIKIIMNTCTFTSESIHETIYLLQEIVRGMTINLFPHRDELATDYLLTVATNLSIFPI